MYIRFRALPGLLTEGEGAGKEYVRLLSCSKQYKAHLQAKFQRRKMPIVKLVYFDAQVQNTCTIVNLWYTNTK